MRGFATKNLNPRAMIFKPVLEFKPPRVDLNNNAWICNENLNPRAMILKPMRGI